MDKENLTTDTAKTIWAGDFGNEYLDRNDKMEDYELRYKNDTGFTQQEIFEKFFQEKIVSVKLRFGLGCEVRKIMRDANPLQKTLKKEKTLMYLYSYSVFSRPL